MAKHAMARSGGGVVACGDDQFAAAQVCESGLDGAFGKPGCVGKRSYARDDWLPFLPRGLAIKIKINQKGGWLLIVADQIAHQNVEHVIVDRNGFAKAHQKIRKRIRNRGKGISEIEGKGATGSAE